MICNDWLLADQYLIHGSSLLDHLFCRMFGGSATVAKRTSIVNDNNGDYWYGQFQGAPQGFVDRTIPFLGLLGFPPAMLCLTGLTSPARTKGEGAACLSCALVMVLPPKKLLYHWQPNMKMQNNHNNCNNR